MEIRYMVQNDSMKPFYDWCYICSFAKLEDAKDFVEKEKKTNSKIKYRIVKKQQKKQNIRRNLTCLILNCTDYIAIDQDQQREILRILESLESGLKR